MHIRPGNPHDNSDWWRIYTLHFTNEETEAKEVQQPARGYPAAEFEDWASHLLSSLSKLNNSWWMKKNRSH